MNKGFVQAEGLRYEDFLPVSAAGIFASNLGQYGTKSTAATKPLYTQEQLETIMGRKIVDSHETYKGLEAESIARTYQQLKISDKVSSPRRQELEKAAAFLA